MGRKVPKGQLCHNCQVQPRNEEECVNYEFIVMGSSSGAFGSTIPYQLGVSENIKYRRTLILLGPIVAKMLCQKILENVNDQFYRL